VLSSAFVKAGIFGCQDVLPSELPVPRNVPEGCQKRERLRQVYDHASQRATTRAPSFSKRSRNVQTCALAQLVPPLLSAVLHQHISCGGQQHAELVGPETAATGAVDLQGVQFFDPVLDFAALQ